jgi:hypothetical protein
MNSGTLKKGDRLADATAAIRVNMLKGKEYFQKSRSLTHSCRRFPRHLTFKNFGLPSVSYIFF